MSSDQWAAAGTGAAGGAMAGMASGNPYLAAGGAILGGLSGFMGADQKGYQLPWDQYNNRLAQIGQFQTQLNGANQSYLNAINNMYNTAYTQYMPNLAAQFAGRGLNVDSGAFAAEAGRTAAVLQGQYNAQAYQSNLNNINAVQSQYANAWDAMFGAANNSNQMGWMNQQQNLSAVGNMAMQGIMAYGNSHPWSGGSGGSSGGSFGTLANSPSMSNYNYTSADAAAPYLSLMGGGQ